MRNVFRFSFTREAWWLVVIYLIVPLLVVFFAIVLPGLWRQWFP